MKLYGKIVVLGGMLFLAACQSAGKPSSVAEESAADDDQCGASQYQNYVGQPLTALEGVRLPAGARAISWNASVTMDFNLHRLNFLADKEQTISRVYCG